MDMNSEILKVSQRHSAILAAIGLVIMTIAVFFADAYAHQGLIIMQDATETANNILSHEPLFRAGIYGYLIVIICDVLVAWALYVFLAPVSRSLSLLTAWSRLVYSIIFAIALFNFSNVLRLLDDENYPTLLTSDQLHAQMMLSLAAFGDEWDIGFVFFGLHLSLLGYLVFKAPNIPKIMGILLSLAGICYLIDNIGEFMLPSYHLALSQYIGWWELVFGFWLLWKGGKIPSPSA
jgi:hypothetical protein